MNLARLFPNVSRAAAAVESVAASIDTKADAALSTVHQAQRVLSYEITDAATEVGDAADAWRRAGDAVELLATVAAVAIIVWVAGKVLP